jgi:cytochrome P450
MLNPSDDDRADFRLVAESSPVNSQFALFDGLRSRRRSFHSDDREGFWVLTRHEDIAAAFRDYSTFSSGSVFVGIPDIPEPWPPVMVDQPEHTVWRRLLAPLFSPRVVAGLEGRITTHCDNLIQKVVSLGSCDFIADFAYRFPTVIFVELMGIPEQDIERLMGWQSLIERPQDGPDGEHLTATAALDLAQYLSDLIDERRADPRTDIISTILRWRIDAKPLSAEDVLSLCMTLCMAGFSNVASQLGYIFWHLATYDADRRRIVTDPGIIPQAVEEFLRLYTIGMTGRKLARDSSLGGCPMKAGDMVLLAMSSANRDPAAFDKPVTAVLDRGAANHLAFGAGIHYCLGANLTRLQLRIALEQWHKLIPEYRIPPDAQVTEYRSQVFWIESLPLTWPAATA